MGKKRSAKERLESEVATVASADTYAPLGHVTLEIPYGDLKPGSKQFEKVHVEMNFLRDQAEALAKLASGCDRAGFCTKNGKRVLGVQQTLRWLVEQASDQIT